MLILVANPMTQNQIMSSAEIAENILIQDQIPLIFANRESKFILIMKWVIIPVSAPIPDRVSIFSDENRALKKSQNAL